MKLQPVPKLPVKFVEVRPWDGCGYSLTNECIKTHRELVKDLTFKRVAAICAGGEVGLTVYGPRCKELILIDHGTIGLAATYMKLAMLHKLKTGTFQRIITEGDPKQVIAHTKKIVPHLPDELCASTYLDLKAGTYVNSPILKEAWDSSDRLKVLKKLLPKITLIHGDLRDLSTMGKFDLIYGSNAIIDHRGFDSKIPSACEMLPCLNPGGYLVFTGNAGQQLDPGFTQIAHTKVVSWDYYVWRKN